MALIIIEHEDPSLMCIHERLCDKLYEVDQIFIPIPMPKIIFLPESIPLLNNDENGIAARQLNIIDFRKAKQILDAKLNVILEGTFTKTMNKNLDYLAENEICTRISLAPNHPKKIINLNPVDDMMDVYTLSEEEIIQNILDMIVHKHKKQA